MKWGIGAIVVIVGAGGILAADLTHAEKTPSNHALRPAAPLGAADFYPSPDTPIGWRGDGNGKYPGATPPLHWGRWPAGIWKDLRCSAKKPKNPGDGNPVSRGMLQDWLVVGPFDVDDPLKALNEELAPQEDALQPDENDKAGERAWKAERYSNTANQHLNMPFGETLSWPKKEGKGARMFYAHTYVYSPSNVTIQLAAGPSRCIKAWCNGKLVLTGNKGWDGISQVKIDLVSGWNRLLIKTHYTVRAKFSPQPPLGYETKNVAWIARMPDYSVSCPLVVGDRIYARAQYGDLLCLNKADGKILWIRTDTGYDFISEEERTNSVVKEKIEPLVSRLKDLNEQAVKDLNELVSRTGPTSVQDEELAKKLAEKRKTLSSIWQLMVGINKGRYQGGVASGECDIVSATPCSDGKYIYLWTWNAAFGSCYDLNGNRRWTTFVPELKQFGGHSGAPSAFIADGIMMVGHGYCGSRGLDCGTGAVVWKSTAIGGTPVVGKPVTINGKKVFLAPGGEVLSPKDGKCLHPNLFSGESVGQHSIVDNGDLMFIGANWGNNWQLYNFGEETKPARLVKEICFTERFGSRREAYHRQKDAIVACPVLDKGLLYVLDGRGDLLVSDTKEGKVVYDAELDLLPAVEHHYGTYSSVILAGNYLFAMDNQGTMAVIVPGREFKQAARNTLEHFRKTQSAFKQETTWSTPVFDGNRMYYRSEDLLYCIEER